MQVAREMGLARFGKLSIDGTKVRANASKRKAMSYERMGQEEARLQGQIEALLRKAGAVDAEEVVRVVMHSPAQFGSDTPQGSSNALPAGLSRAALPPVRLAHSEVA